MTADASQGLVPVSFAAAPGGFVASYWLMATNAGYIVFFDRQGVIYSGPNPGGGDLRRYGDGFVRVTVDGVALYGATGTVTDPPRQPGIEFHLVAVEGERLCGWVPELVAEPTVRLACLRRASTGWTVEPLDALASRVDTHHYAFAPDRYLVTSDGGYHSGAGASAALYVAGADGTLVRTDVALPGVIVADAAWDPAAAAFRVLVGYDAGDGSVIASEFRPRLVRVDASGVTEEPALDAAESQLGTWGITGSITLGTGSTALAYLLPRPEALAQLDVLRASGRQHLGAAFFGGASTGYSTPLVAPTADAFSLLYTSQSNGRSALVFRCDLPQ